LDELGRGTSTFDGTAIAYSALVYFLTKIQCITMFVTHYPSLGSLESIFAPAIKNYHMGFMEIDGSEGTAFNLLYCTLYTDELKGTMEMLLYKSLTSLC